MTKYMIVQTTDTTTAQPGVGGVWADSGDAPKCLHDSCPQCNGTGQKIDGSGYCFHNISCPCPKCSPR